MNEPTDPPRSGSDALDPTVRDTIERVDAQIGPYRLLERVGEGAMGEVWRAEQSEPIKRILALKIIKRGMDTREAVTRFEIERQAMALMDHPWIAKVHDAGETEGGRPFIAMEYVAGEKLTDYCERNKLSIEARLKLFQKICQAIHHAHQKAVIHRDLKPSNILVVEVDGEPVPKVIDFGIAKATAQRLTDRSAATFVGQLIGTPLYMSPEQLEMSAAGVDTRADVYSLGVILYELLSGALPHEPEKLAHAAFDQVLRVLREEEPARPSTRVSTLGDRTAEIAARRGLDAKKLAGKLKGDLDWIALKALEKDRRRRYESPKDIADDIDRYLRMDAIEARPPSMGYRTSRFVRRHRSSVALAATAVLALVAIAIWQKILLGVISNERDRAMANERLSLAREHLDEDPTVAVAFALSSLEILDQLGARHLVREALAEAPLRDEWPRYDAPGNPITVDASADGRLCAVAWSQSRNPTVGVYDVGTLDMRLLTAPTRGIAYSVLLNADATHVASLGSDGIHVWRLSDGAHRWHLEEPTIEDAELHRSADPTKLWVTSHAVDDGPVVIHEIDLLSGTMSEIGRTRGRHHPNVQHHNMWIDPAGIWVLDYDGNQIHLQRMDELADSAAVEVGRHDAPVSSVTCDVTARMAASIDVQGRVRVWSLAGNPFRMVAQYDQEPGAYVIETDPFGTRFFTSWGNARLRLFEPFARPLRLPIELQDRTHWTHDGAFLPDRSVVTAANGRSIRRWRADPPRAWSFAKPDSLGGNFHSTIGIEGRWLYVWARAGQVMAFPLLESEGDETRLLARTPPWDIGSWSEFRVSADGRRAVTYTSSEPGPRIIDLETGEARILAASQTRRLDAVSRSAEMACMMTSGDAGEHTVIEVVDLDSFDVRARFLTGETAYRSVAFDTDAALVGLASDHVVRFDLSNPQARPDTLWCGDARGLGLLLDDGRSVVVRDAQMNVRWIDLVGGEQVRLGTTPRQQLGCAALDPTGRLLAIGGWWDVIHVYDLQSGQEWRLPAAGERGGRMTDDLDFDPLGRWLVSTHGSELIGWRLPLDDLFSDLPSEVLLERLRSSTNVRVVPDPSDPVGFRITNTVDFERLARENQ